MTRIARIALLTAVMSFSFLAVASAHTSKFDSTVSIKDKKNGQDPDSLEGQVTSPKPKCQAERSIKIFERAGDAKTLAGTTTTDADGNYEFFLSENTEPRTFYAVATRKVLRNNNKHRHVCKRAKSEDITTG